MKHTLSVKEVKFWSMKCARSTKFTLVLCVCSLAFFLVLLKSWGIAKKDPLVNQAAYPKLKKSLESYNSFPECSLSQRTNSCDIKINVLVTGVAGFVGSHVAENVMKISKKILVVGADDLSAFGEVQRINIPPNVKFIEGDLSKEDFVLKVFQNHGPIDVEGAGSKTGGFHDPSWKELHPKLIQFARKNKWSERRGETIFWRGSVKTNPARRALIRCSKNIVDATDVQHKLRVGKPIGALDRVMFKYLIYLDGKSFSSAVLPMLVTGAAIFLPNDSPFQTLCQRAFRENGFHQVFNVSVSQGILCRTLSKILSGLKNDELQVEKRAKEALDWAETQLSMLAFQKYMVAILKRYADLLKYTPTRTKNTVEVSWKLIKKNVKRKQ